MVGENPGFLLGDDAVLVRIAIGDRLVEFKVSSGHDFVFVLKRRWECSASLRRQLPVLKQLAVRF
jgi:hypothetical protein